MRLVTVNEAEIATADVAPGAKAICMTLSDCACGQQLDLCRGDHCPRCGRSLPHS